MVKKVLCIVACVAVGAAGWCLGRDYVMSQSMTVFGVGISSAMDGVDLAALNAMAPARRCVARARGQRRPGGGSSRVGGTMMRRAIFWVKSGLFELQGAIGESGKV